MATKIICDKCKQDAGPIHYELHVSKQDNTKDRDDFNCLLGETVVDWDVCPTCYRKLNLTG